MRPPDDCIVCGQAIEPQQPQDVHKASWGPVTLYYHHECHVYYRDGLAPRLRDSLVRTIRRWVLQDQPTIARPRKEPHEPNDP
jgi:hypothetical protein